jgi:hypothetical protein
MHADVTFGTGDETEMKRVQMSLNLAKFKWRESLNISYSVISCDDFASEILVYCTFSSLRII